MGLSDSQLAKLAANRKDVLPDYYDADSGSTVIIPSSTKDALILLGTETKRKATAYIKVYLDASSGAFAKDYNDLLTEFVEQQVANGDAVVSELQQVTGKFNDFRRQLSGELTETNLIIEEGMQPVLEAMSRALGRLGEIDRSETFHNRFNGVMEAQFKQELADTTKKELRSWLRVIASYP